MKKILAILTVLITVLTVFSGCSTESGTTDDKRISVVCTIFPQYDITEKIVSGNADVTMLLQPGAEAHGYEPTLRDLNKIFSSDIFIYCSGESESWTENVLKEINKSKTVAIDIRNGIDLISSKNEDEHSHSDEDHDHHGDHEHDEYDEHVWTSPKTAIIITESILNSLCEADKSNAHIYKSNAQSLIDKFNELDAKMQAISNSGKNLLMIFADRFPFAYLARDYGFEYYAAFNGCSSNTEISISTVSSLCDKVQQSGSDTVFYTETSDGRIADTVCSSTGAVKKQLHSMHNISKEEFTNKLSFTNIMDKNISILSEVFG